MKTRIFISYSRVDQTPTNQLIDLLSKAYEILIDQQLVGGDIWWAEILEKIAQCNHFIYLISRDSLESEWCTKELAEARRLEKHIIPVLVRARTEVQEELQRLQLVDMSEGITPENLNQLYAALIKSTNQNPDLEVDKKRQSADMRLLHQLWPLISIENIVRLDSQTQGHYIDADFYQGTVIRYLHLRDLYDNPQNEFFNPTLEKTFNVFDEALRAYNYQKATNAFSFEILNGREVFMSDYKICKYRSHGIPYETITFKLEEYNKTVDLFLIVRERHRELVNAIKSVIPDFDFSGENA